MSSRSRDLSPPKRWTTRDGSLNGRPRRNRSLIRLKIAVFNPIPIASVIIASAENPGDLRSWRRANFRSFMLFGAQCFNWIDESCAARGEQTREQRSRAEDYECRAEQKRIVS